MADLPEHIQKTISELRDDVTISIREAAEHLALLNRLESKYGLHQTALQELIDNAVEGIAFEVRSSPASPTEKINPSFAQRLGVQPIRQNIRPDQFLGMEPLEAAKSHLTNVHHALHIDDIAEAVQKGGAAIKGTDWKDKLEQSLLRSVYDVIKAQDKTFGLMSFYTPEQIKRLRETRRQAAPKGKKGKRGRPKGSKNKSKAAAAPMGTEPPAAPKLTAEQIERIKQLHAAGKRPGEIAKELNRHHLVIARIIRDFGRSNAARGKEGSGG